MLQLLHLKKTYHVGDTVTHALNDVTINFRNSEFVAILGPSGSGKTITILVTSSLTVSLPRTFLKLTGMLTVTILLALSFKATI